jgi:multiple sugar transport system substrate-binding protein
MSQSLPLRVRASVTRRRAIAWSTALSFLGAACGVRTPAPAGESASAQLKPGTIRYLHWDRPRDEVYQQVWDEFSAKHPGVKVELMTIPSGVSYLDKLTSMIVANDPPDIFALDRSQLDPFVHQGAMVDLTPLVKRDAAKARWNDILPSLQSQYTYEGKIVEFPNGPVNIGIFYNKDAFDRAGLKLPAESWTWDDLLETARALTERTPGGDVVQWGLGWVNSFFEPWVWANGGEVYDKPFNMTKCLLDQPAAYNGIQWYADLIHRRGVAPRQSQYQGFSVWEMFYKAPVRFPMVMSGSWRVPDIMKNAQFQWDVAPLPKGPAGTNGGITWSGGTCIARVSKVIEQSWALTLFMWGPERERQVVMQTGANLRANLPNYITTIKDPEVNRTLDRLAAAGTIPRNYGRVFFHALLSDRERPILPGYAAADASKALNGALNDVWEGNRGAAEALRAAVPVINAALANKPR